jgi:Zn-dependent protease with chaperone function
LLGLALIAGAIGLLAATHNLDGWVAVALPIALPVLFVGSIFLLQGAVGLRLEYAADDFARQTVGLDPTVRALEKLAELNMAKRKTGRFFNLMTQHPAIEERVDRLKATAGAGAQEPN